MRRHRILVIDDNADVREMMHALFVSYGYEVTVAASGPHALELIKEKPPHIAFVDLMMPAPNGIEVLRELRRLFNGKIIRILYTASPDARTLLDAVNSGDAFKTISKPWKTDVLDQVLRDACEESDHSNLFRGLAEIQAALGLAQNETRRHGEAIAALNNEVDEVRDSTNPGIDPAALHLAAAEFPEVKRQVSQHGEKLLIVEQVVRQLQGTPSMPPRADAPAPPPPTLTTVVEQNMLAAKNRAALERKEDRRYFWIKLLGVVFGGVSSLTAVAALALTYYFATHR